MNALFGSDYGAGSPSMGRRIAVIGSGISGLSAAWLLGSRHNVTLYEKDGHLGGHSNTVEVAGPRGPIAVDTGFIVYNPPNYPNLTALFEHLGVDTVATNMSFAASIDDGEFEYSSADLNGLLGQRRNIVRPRFWRMIRDIIRFYAESRSLAASGHDGNSTLRQHIAARGYSGELRDDHVIPLCAAIWSASPDQILDMPLAAFVRFFSNHGLLEIGARPNWRTVRGGSRSYVDKLVQSGRFTVRPMGAELVHRHADGVSIKDASGAIADYDEVVIATHADQALALLDDPTPAEHELLGAIRYTPNLTVLHRDKSLMPHRRRVWSSWNFAGSSEDLPGRPLCVTYWMNSLQSLDPGLDLFVTLNPPEPIASHLIEGTYSYSHPVFDATTIATQKRLWTLQGAHRTWYCGAHFGYGFHEDGLQSGLAVAEQLGGVTRPWSVANASSRITAPDPALLSVA